METRKPDEIGEMGEEIVGKVKHQHLRPSETKNSMKISFFGVSLLISSGLLPGCGLLKAPDTQLTTLPAIQKEQAWFQFTSTRGGYSIDFPGAAQEKDESIPNARSFTAAVRVTGASGNRYFAATSTTTLPGALKRIGARSFLESQYREAYAHTAKDSLIYKKSFLYQGVPALEWSYQSIPKRSGRPVIRAVMRLFIVKDTIYNLSVTAPSTRAAGDFDKFADSFRLGKPPISPKWERD